MGFSFSYIFFFFFNDTATTEIYTLSLHDALPIWSRTLCVTAPVTRIPLAVTELAATPKADREDEALALAAREARQPFDLENGPLFRFRLYRLRPSEHVALVVMHHIISDFWSVRLFVKELLTGYQARLRGEETAMEPLPVRYADFAAWQREQLRGEKLEQLFGYWRQYLAGAPLFEFSSDRPRPARSSMEAATETIVFPRELTGTLRRFARREGVTTFTVLLAAFNALAVRCSNQTDVVVGTTSAHRGRRELERLIGFFAAPLPVRTRLPKDPSFREVLQHTRRALLECYAHQELPFAQISEAAHAGRQRGNQPLFRVLFSALQPLLPVSEIADLKLKPLELGNGVTDFDLFLNIVEEDRDYQMLILYSKDLYNAETIRNLMALYLELLRTNIEAPLTRISALPAPEGLTPCRLRTEPPENALPVAVTATFTAEPVQEILAFWLRELEFDYRIQFAPYNQVFQQLLDPASLIGRNHGGVNVVLVRLEDWARDTVAGHANDLEGNVRQFLEAIQSATTRSPAPFLICLCPASPEFTGDPRKAALERRLTEMIRSTLAGISAVHVADAAELAALYPVEHYYDQIGRASCRERV